MAYLAGTLIAVVHHFGRYADAVVRINLALHLHIKRTNRNVVLFHNTFREIYGTVGRNRNSLLHLSYSPFSQLFELLYHTARVCSTRISTIHHIFSIFNRS